MKLTTEDVSTMINQILEENNMAFDVSAVIRPNNVTFLIKVKEKSEQQAEDGQQGNN